MIDLAGAFGFEPTKAPAEENIITTTRSHTTKVVSETIEACEPTEVLKVGGAGHKVSYEGQGWGPRSEQL